MQTLFDMLTYKRPMDSKTEEDFITKFLVPLGVERDEIGNIWKRVGDSNVLWSSHTDTVHHTDGMQKLKITDHRVSLPADSDSNCLGADCTTGVFIMTELIKAKKPGLYVFHRGEERGSKGSKFIAKDKTLLEGIDMAIAFDRYGTSSIITHQGGRCCSDAFADSVSEQIPFLNKDMNGIFTDTANYDHIVPECTNFSVGYDNHHTKAEYQDLDYLEFFIGAMKMLDTSKLVVERDPSVMSTYTHFTNWNDFDSDAHFFGYGDYSGTSMYSDLDELLTLVKANPRATASLLKAYGVTSSELLEYTYVHSGH